MAYEHGEANDTYKKVDDGDPELYDFDPSTIPAHIFEELCALPEFFAMVVENVSLATEKTAGYLRVHCFWLTADSAFSVKNVQGTNTECGGGPLVDKVWGLQSAIVKLFHKHLIETRNISSTTPNKLRAWMQVHPANRDVLYGPAWDGPMAR